VDIASNLSSSDVSSHSADLCTEFLAIGDGKPKPVINDISNWFIEPVVLSKSSADTLTNGFNEPNVDKDKDSEPHDDAQSECNAYDFCDAVRNSNSQRYSESDAICDED